MPKSRSTKTGQLESMKIEPKATQDSQIASNRNATSAASTQADRLLPDSKAKPTAVAERATEAHQLDEEITIPTVSGVASIAVSPDGRHLVGSMIGKPPVIQIWNVHTGERVQRIESNSQDDPTPSQLQFTPDGKQLLYVNGRTVHRMTFGEQQGSLQQEFPAGPSLVVFPKSDLALALFHVQAVHRTKKREVPQRARVWNWRTNEVLYDEAFPIQKNAALWAPAVSRDERYLSMAWGNNYTIRYDISADNRQFTLGRRFAMEKFSRIRGPLIYSPEFETGGLQRQVESLYGNFL